jgi:hypothetical protein
MVLGRGLWQPVFPGHGEDPNVPGQERKLLMIFDY